MDRRKVFAVWMEELGYEQVSMQLVIRSRLCWEEDWKVGEAARNSGTQDCGESILAAELRV